MLQYMFNAFFKYLKNIFLILTLGCDLFQSWMTLFSVIHAEILNLEEFFIACVEEKIHLYTLILMA